MKNVCLFIAFLMAMGMQAQNLQNANWYFGFNRAFSFAPPNQFTPYAVSGSEMQTSESCASVSDALGNLLFYTDGTSVWKAGTSTPFGTGLFGNDSNTQGAVIVPKPGFPSRYYIFTMDGATGTQNGLYYNEVDTSSWTIVDLNHPLMASNVNRSEKLTATKHFDNLNYWIIFHTGRTVLSYKITSAGPTYASSVSAPVAIDTPSLPDPSVGQMKISPDGSRIGICYQSGTVAIGTFNNNTGAISFPNGPITVPGAYSLEFSPDSNWVYMSTTGGSPYPAGTTLLYSNTSTISAQALTTIYGGGPMQLALNGKIYLSGGTDLAVMNNPNNPSSLNFGTPIELNGVVGNLPQWVPMHGQDPCTSLTLTSEPNTTYTYAFRSDITTQGAYAVNSGKNITMKAGNFIVLKPDTHIKSGSTFLAKIENCTLPVDAGGVVHRQAAPIQTTEETEGLTTIKTFSLIPNPATTRVTINASVGVQSVMVTSIDGKIMFSREYKDKSASVDIDINSYAQGYYTVTVITIDGQVQTQKLIKN